MNALIQPDETLRIQFMQRAERAAGLPELPAGKRPTVTRIDGEPVRAGDKRTLPKTQALDLIRRGLAVGA